MEVTRRTLLGTAAAATVLPARARAQSSRHPHWRFERSIGSFIATTRDPPA